MRDTPYSIVLVEDNHADTFLLRQALEDAELHFDLTVLEDGGEAVEFFREHEANPTRTSPDLVVLDLNLPKYGGLEVLTALRSTEAGRDIPVIITSSSDNPEDRRQTEELAVSAYIIKPSDLDEFLQIGKIIKQLLTEKRPRGANGSPVT
jgi:CheY-like chemotaxis protein